MLTPVEAMRMRTPEKVAYDIENEIDDAVNRALNTPFFPMWSDGRWVVILDAVRGPDGLTDEVVLRFTKCAAELGWRVVGPSQSLLKLHLVVEPI